MSKIILAILSCMFISQSLIGMNEEEEDNDIVLSKQIFSKKNSLLSSKLSKEDESYLLGMTYYDRCNYDRALLYLKEAAEYDNYNAEYVIGSIYEFIKRNYEEAEKWYNRAEDHGEKKAIEAKIRVKELKNKEEIRHLKSLFRIFSLKDQAKSSPPKSRPSLQNGIYLSHDHLENISTVQKIINEKLNSYTQEEIINILSPNVHHGTNTTNIYRRIFNGTRRDSPPEECISNYLKWKQKNTQLSLITFAMESDDENSLFNKHFPSHLQREIDQQLLQKIKCVYDENQTSLNLEQNKSNKVKYTNIAKGLANNTTLTELNLNYNNIGDEGAIYLAKNTTITSLDLWGNNIGDEGAIYLANNNTLTILHLTSNKIRIHGVDALARNKTLKSLYLSANNIGDEGAKALAYNTTLKSLYLNRNNIGNEGAEALGRNTALTLLELSANNIGDEGAIYLAKNNTLTKLILDKNNIGKKGAEALIKSKIEVVHITPIGGRISQQWIDTMMEESNRDPQYGNLLPYIPPFEIPIEGPNVIEGIRVDPINPLVPPVNPNPKAFPKPEGGPFY